APSRAPASVTSPSGKTPVLPERRPIILFMIDGMRPDRLVQAAKEGWMPHLKSLVVDRGTRLQTYASRALTLPSWATILTGFEPDIHGIQSNAPANRLLHKIADNYQDPRKD